MKATETTMPLPLSASMSASSGADVAVQNGRPVRSNLTCCASIDTTEATSLASSSSSASASASVSHLVIQRNNVVTIGRCPFKLGKTTKARAYSHLSRRILCVNAVHLLTGLRVLITFIPFSSLKRAKNQHLREMRICERLTLNWEGRRQLCGQVQGPVVASAVVRKFPFERFQDSHTRRSELRQRRTRQREVFVPTVISARPLRGASLAALLQNNGGTFSISTAFSVCRQINEILRIFHRSGLCLGVLSPEIFATGVASEAGHVFLTNTSRCAALRNVSNCSQRRPITPTSNRSSLSTNEIRDRRSGKTETETTATRTSNSIMFRFASASRHSGMKPSPKDDVQSLLYLLIFFVKGFLPWDRITATNFLKSPSCPSFIRDNEKNECKVIKMKNEIQAADLCAGLPPETAEFCTYCKTLAEGDQPDYEYIDTLLLAGLREGCGGSSSAADHKFRYDFFDWEKSSVNLRSSLHL